MSRRDESVSRSNNLEERQNLVLRRGLEPPRPFGHMNLNHTRIPVPPPEHQDPADTAAKAPSLSTPGPIGPRQFMFILEQVDKFRARNFGKFLQRRKVGLALEFESAQHLGRLCGIQPRLNPLP